jgi:CelD/BcsL family acetyltransferase involved in cellulose biosynthesis
MTLSAEVKRPSALDAAEHAAWLAFMVAQPPLRRAFFAPAFALAAERAHGRAFVAVLRRAGRPVGFFPFQFKGAWQQAVGLAERVGGELSDNAGLVAEPGLVLTPETLLRLAGLGAAFITHLMEGQEAYGLAAAQTRIGHLVEIEAGPEAAIARLEATNKAFVHETRRRLRRVEREIGPLAFDFALRPDPAAVEEVIATKREQYGRTGMGDPFTDPAYLRLVRALVESPDPHCLPVLETLSAGGRVIARHFGLMYDDHLSYWFPVYDLGLSKLSPGRLQLWHTITTAAATGVRLIDLGEGDSQAKRDFSTRPIALGWAAWHAGTPRGLVARAARALAWRLGR